MGSLLVITGPPGAGKSTIAAMLADGTEKSVLVSGDRFFDFLAAGAIEPWLPESHQQNTIVTRLQLQPPDASRKTTRRSTTG